MSFFTDIAFPWVHGEEGGYSNDPRDRGNWTGGACGVGECKGTKYGISAASFPDLDIASLTLSDAQRVAKRNYWDIFGGDDLPPAVALCVFDFGYNAGVHESCKVLQRAVSAIPDGDIGPQTLAAVACRSVSSVVTAFTTQRIAAYRLMGEFPLYGNTWMQRALDTQTKALSL